MCGCRKRWSRNLKSLQVSSLLIHSMWIDSGSTGSCTKRLTCPEGKHAPPQGHEPYWWLLISLLWQVTFTGKADAFQMLSQYSRMERSEEK